MTISQCLHGLIALRRRVLNYITENTWKHQLFLLSNLPACSPSFRCLDKILSHIIVYDVCARASTYQASSLLSDHSTAPQVDLPWLLSPLWRGLVEVAPLHHTWPPKPAGPAAPPCPVHRPRQSFQRAKDSRPRLNEKEEQKNIRWDSSLGRRIVAWKLKQDNGLGSKFEMASNSGYQRG